MSSSSSNKRRKIEDDASSEEEEEFGSDVEEKKDVSKMTELERETYLFEQDKKKRERQELEKLEASKKKTPPKRRVTKGAERSDSESSSSSSGEGSSSSSESGGSESGSDDEFVDGDDKKSAAKKKSKRVTSPRKKPARSTKAGKQRMKEKFQDSDSEAVSSDESEDIDTKKRLKSAPLRHKGRRGHDHDDEESDEEDETPVSYSELLEMQLTRQVLVEWCDESYWESCIGGFVRLCVGSGRYIVCQISDTSTTPAPYKVDGVLIDQALVLKRDYGDEREMKLDRISNVKFERKEFEDWMKTLNTTVEKLSSKRDKKEAREDIPTKSFAQRFVTRIQKEVGQHVRTAAEIRQKVEKKAARRKKFSNITVEKERIERQLKELKKDDEEKRSELEVRLETVKDVQKKKIAVASKTYNINREINRRNAKENRDRGAGGERLGRRDTGEGEVWNPFARMPTRPNNLWSTAGPDEKKPADDDEVEEDKSKEDSKVSQVKKGVSSSISTDLSDPLGLSPLKKKVSRVQEVKKTIHGHISIDVEIGDNPTAVSSSSSGAKEKKRTGIIRKKKAKKKTGGKKMSLSEYISKLNSAAAPE